jgi:hypothetical protein
MANFSATPETQYEVCFVTSVYSSSANAADHPPSVQDMKEQNPTFRFFAFTNLADLQAPGWTVLVKNLTRYKRFITQSRWAKFMAWTDPLVSQVSTRTVGTGNFIWGELPTVYSNDPIQIQLLLVPSRNLYGWILQTKGEVFRTIQIYGQGDR